MDRRVPSQCSLVPTLSRRVRVHIKLKGIANATAAKVKGTGTAHFGRVQQALVGTRQTSFTVKTTARWTILTRRVGPVAAGLIDIAPIGTGATRLGGQFRPRRNGARQTRLTIGRLRALFKRAQFATIGRSAKKARHTATPKAAHGIVAQRVGSTDGRRRDDTLVDIGATGRRAGKAHLARADKAPFGIATIFRGEPARRDAFGTFVAIDTATKWCQRSIAIVALTGIGAGRIGASAIGTARIRRRTAFVDIGAKRGGRSASVSALARARKGTEGIGAIGIGPARRPLPTLVPIDARAV
jgi:hypothetical protein